MFGANPLRKREHGDGSTLLVQGQPFYTIQGEGPFAGYPATFIRLWGCHLHCYFCDTDFESDKRCMSIDTIATQCAPKSLVVLTGGEPMRQNIRPLALLLEEREHLVQIETAGGFWLEGLSHTVTIVVSPKTPRINPNIRWEADAWKYIISAEHLIHPDDGLPCMDTQSIRDPKIVKLARPPEHISPHTIFLQPMDEQDEAKNAANRDLCVALAKEHGYRISLQQHKILGVP